MCSRIAQTAHVFVRDIFCYTYICSKYTENEIKRRRKKYEKEVSNPKETAAQPNVDC